MSKTYDAYLPKKKETKLAQGPIDVKLHERVSSVLEEENWSWGELLTGLLTKFMDDRKSKKVS